MSRYVSVKPESSLSRQFEREINIEITSKIFMRSYQEPNKRSGKWHLKLKRDRIKSDKVSIKWRKRRFLIDSKSNGWNKN